MKNNKKIFLTLTLIVLLLGVTAVAAAENEITSNTDVVSDTTADETVVTQQVQTSTNSDVETKDVEKEDKNLKTSTRTFEVNDLESLQNATYEQLYDTENDTYIININQNITNTTAHSLSLSSASEVKTVIYNGNNNTINSMNMISVGSDHECVINNMTVYIDNMIRNNGGTLTINNSKIIINSSRYAMGIISGLTIIEDNSQINIINGAISYRGGTICTNDTTLIQKLKDAGCPEENILTGGGDDKNIIIENQNINQNYFVESTYNYTFINCQINSKITNNGNISLINCSLSNNDMTINSGYGNGIYTFLLENNGNMTILDCVIENNTFNHTSTTGDSYSAIIYNKNNATLVLNNTRVNNNTHIGNQIAFIYSTDESTLTITNSLFENHTFKIESDTTFYNARNKNLLNAINLTVKNSNFNNNKYIFQESGVAGGGTEPSGIAIRATNLNVDNCTFDSNGIISKHEYAGEGGYGGAISATNLIVNNSRFTNNVANTTSPWWPTIGTGGAIYVSGDAEIYNSIFEDNMASKKGADIYSTGNLIIQNNTFTNSYTGNTASSIYSDAYQPFVNQFSITVTDNTFNNCKSSSDTIVIEQEGKEINKLIENNNYNNNSINDELILNIPENIYTGEPTTIKGTYTINNPQYYDEDILEQNQFNVYINGELDQTVDTLEFTITPTESNMILTVQPTISQTRKSAIIQASTLNITLEPITATMGKTAQLTTQITLITDDTEMDVNTGRVYFKVNGKILRDTETGRILYADVTENTATLDYIVPKTWNEDTTIEAVFTGNDNLPQKTSNIVNPTITTPETSEMEFSVADTTATAGEEVTITVTTKNLDNGKIVLKINGKTVKAADGKLYAKVTDETTTFTYTVPKTYKTGEYAIKAVYTSGATKLEAESKLTLM